MEIICIEGPHGCGKTAVCKRLDRLGYKTLDEGFLDMPKCDLDPQSFTMETIWMTNWVNRVLEEKRAGGGKFYADRSPLSALIYAKEGKLLKIVIKQIIAELHEVGIKVRTVYLDTSEEVLWNRINKRLEKDPSRKKYNEDSHDWMLKVRQMYAEVDWDYHVCADGSITGVCNAILKI